MSAVATTTPTSGYGERIRRARIGVNKTRMQLAYALGVHYNSVAGWERENHVPNEIMLIRIAKVTKTTVIWLLYGE